MKSFRDMAKSSAEKKMKMYGAKDNEVSSSIKNAQKYQDGGCIKKADGGSVGSEDLDEMDGGMGKARMDRGGKKASTTVNIIVGKSGPDAGAMPPPSIPMGGPPPMPAGPAPMPPMRASGGRVGKADGGAISKERTEYAKTKEAEAKDAGAKGGASALAAGIGLGLLGSKSHFGKALGTSLGSVGAYETGKKTIEKGMAGKEARWARSGLAEEGKEDRAKGGRVHLTGGADSGIGRLEKNHKK